MLHLVEGFMLAALLLCYVFYAWFVPRYEAKRWVLKSHKPPLCDERCVRDERQPFREGTPWRALGEGNRDCKGADFGNADKHNKHERASEQTLNGSVIQEASRPARHSVQSAATFTSLQPPASTGPTSGIRLPLSSTLVSSARSKRDSPSSGFAPKSSDVLTHPALATSQPPPEREMESNLLDLLSIKDEIPIATSSSEDDESWATFQSAESTASTDEKTNPLNIGPSFGDGQKPTENDQEASVRSSATAGLEELFKCRPDATKNAYGPSKDVLQSILSLFETQSSKVPYIAPQQQMAAPVKHLPARFDASSPVAGMQGYQHGNASKKEMGTSAPSLGEVSGPFWPAGVSLSQGTINPANPSRGQSSATKGSEDVALNLRGHGSGGSLYGGPVAGVTSYGTGGRSLSYGSGSFAVDDTNSTGGTDFPKHPPAPPSLTTPGSSYDFSSLTANAFTKR